MPIHSLQPAAVACNWRESMNTNHTTRLAGLLTAMLMTLAINGAMLSKFNSVAQEGYASNSQASNVVTLQTVSVVAHRS